MLSMYIDDEDDEMEEDDFVQEEQPREPPQDHDYSDPRGEEDALMVDSDRVLAADSGNDENTPQDVVNDENSTPSKAQFRPPTPQQAQASFTSPPPPPRPPSQRSSRGKLAIVDYGHDEVAMSPEAEVV